MIAALSLDADQSALRDAIASACAELPAGAPFDAGRWRMLAQLGALGAGSDGESGAGELVAVFEALGEVAHAGPLVETVIALAALGTSGERGPIERGEAFASVGAVPLWPFGEDASLYFAIAEEELWRARPTGESTALMTLAGDPWMRSGAELGERIEAGRDALALGRVAAAAALASAGRRLIEDAAERARTRRQFGRPIGDYQSVAHPLAECAIRLGASEALARTAAWHLDHPDAADGAHELARSAFESARESALAAAYQAHQTFGALGITLEGPVFGISRRIRQWASLPLRGVER